MKNALVSALLLLLIVLPACTVQPALPATATVPAVSPTPTETEWPTPFFPPSATPNPTATPRPTTQADEFAFSQLKRLGRGVNFGNALESPKEGDWGVVLQENFFDLIKDAGFNSIRVPISWSSHAQGQAPYTIDSAFFKRVDWVIEQGTKRNLALILDFHNYGSEINTHPEKEQDRFLGIWKQVAEHYSSAPDSVYFELLNEPNDTLGRTNAWNQMANAAISLIRQSNPHRTIVLGGGNWNDIPSMNDLQLPEADRNLIVTFHYYSPFHFTHQGAEWADGSTAWMGTTWDDKPEEEKAVTADLDMAAAWSKLNARPVFMGEFGAYSKADMASRERWTTFVARDAEKHGFSWAYWEFCAGFGVYDPVKKHWNEPIKRSLLP